MSVVAPLAIGFVFAWLLQRAGLSRYDRIVNVFRLRDLAVLKFLMSALLTAAIGVRLLASLGFAEELPIPDTYVAGNLLGGVVFGVGMALAGFCPGTVAAGAGEGRLDNLVPGMLGLFVGALVYGAGYDRVMPVLARLGHVGAVTFADLMHADAGWLVLVFAELTALLFYALERVPFFAAVGHEPEERA